MAVRQHRNIRLHALTAALALGCAASPAFAGQANLSGLKANGSYDRFIVNYLANSAPASDTVSLAASLNSAAANVALPAAAKGKRVGLKHLRTMALGGKVVTADKRLNRDEAEALMRQIAADPNVASVELDLMARQLATPNDTRYGEQWHYAASAVGANLPGAWDRTTGTGMVVAVIDSGIASHTDLNANILPGYDFVSSIAGGNCGDGVNFDCGASEDGDGRDANPTDNSGTTSGYHGTHVAGTIGAVTNNASGVAGVAYGAKVVPLRTLGKRGAGFTSDIADAIVWASGGTVASVPANANPADVINMSLGSDQACTKAYQDAINIATANGAIVVAAAGNSNIDVTGSNPASCNNVISVAASDKNGNRAWYSTYGTSIDITAPGGETCSPNSEFLPLNTDPSTVGCSRNHPADGVLSTLNNNSFGFMQGTSMASPHVAGIVALMQAVSTTPKTTAQIASLLASTARPITAAKCPGGCGPGLVDTAAAVAAAAGTTPPTGAQTYSNGTDVNIPDNNATGVSSNIVVSGRTGNAPSNASVTVNIIHPYKSDLIVDLIAPDGSVYNIHNRTGADADNVSGTFTLNLSSEALNGTWKLRAADRAAQDIGRIDTWSITF